MKNIKIANVKLIKVNNECQKYIVSRNKHNIYLSQNSECSKNFFRISNINIENNEFIVSIESRNNNKYHSVEDPFSLYLQNNCKFQSLVITEKANKKIQTFYFNFNENKTDVWAIFKCEKYGVTFRENFYEHGDFIVFHVGRKAPKVFAIRSYSENVLIQYNENTRYLIEADREMFDSSCRIVPNDNWYDFTEEANNLVDNFSSILISKNYNYSRFCLFLEKNKIDCEISKFNLGSDFYKKRYIFCSSVYTMESERFLFASLNWFKSSQYGTSSINVYLDGKTAGILLSTKEEINFDIKDKNNVISNYSFFIHGEVFFYWISFSGFYSKVNISKRYSSNEYSITK